MDGDQWSVVSYQWLSCGTPFFYSDCRAWLSQAAQALDLPVEALALSMGMSHDFESAVQCGATHVRVGSTIFGARARKQDSGLAVPLAVSQSVPLAT